MNDWVHSLGQFGMKKTPVRKRYGYETLQLGQVPTFVNRCSLGKFPLSSPGASIYAKQAEILASKMQLFVEKAVL